VIAEYSIQSEYLFILAWRRTRNNRCNVVSVLQTPRVELETANQAKWLAVSPPKDDGVQLGENFSMSDSPAGEYVVRVPGRMFVARLIVPEGGWGWVEIGDE